MPSVSDVRNKDNKQPTHQLTPPAMSSSLCHQQSPKHSSNAPFLAPSQHVPPQPHHAVPPSTLLMCLPTFLLMSRTFSQSFVFFFFTPRSNSEQDYFLCDHHVPFLALFPPPLSPFHAPKLLPRAGHPQCSVQITNARVPIAPFSNKCTRTLSPERPMTTQTGTLSPILTCHLFPAPLHARPHAPQHLQGTLPPTNLSPLTFRLPS